MKLTMRLFKRKLTGVFYVEFRRGKAKSLNTTDPIEAESLYKEIKRLYLEGKLADLDKSSSRLTISQYKKYFLKTHTDISSKTYDGYELGLRLFIDSIGASTLLYYVLPAPLCDVLDTFQKRLQIRIFAELLRTEIPRLPGLVVVIPKRFPLEVDALLQEVVAIG